jgi:hypothetical protein
MDDLENLNPGEEDSPNFRQLRERFNETQTRATEAEARARKAEMRAAVAESGIKMNPQTKFFLDHYDGDPDPDSLKSALTEHGFLEEKPPEPLVSPQEVQAHGQFSEAQAGAEVSGLQDDGHYEELRKLYADSGAMSDPHELIQKATEIMERHGQKVVSNQEDSLR